MRRLAPPSPSPASSPSYPLPVPQSPEDTATRRTSQLRQQASSRPFPSGRTNQGPGRGARTPTPSCGGLWRMAKAREAHTFRAHAQGLAGSHPSTPPSHALRPPHTEEGGLPLPPRASYQEKPWVSRAGLSLTSPPRPPPPPAIITAAGASAWEAGQGHFGSAHHHHPPPQPAPPPAKVRRAGTVASRWQCDWVPV